MSVNRAIFFEVDCQLSHAAVRTVKNSSLGRGLGSGILRRSMKSSGLRSFFDSARWLLRQDLVMRAKVICGLVTVLCLSAAIAGADSLELTNGSLIRGRFVGGTETEIKFQVGSSVQRYNITDVASIKFDPERITSEMPERRDQTREAIGSVTIPAGTRLSVRTIDPIDSTKNHVGDRFQASLEEPLIVDGKVVVPKGADVYGRLDEAKTSGPSESFRKQ